MTTVSACRQALCGEQRETNGRGGGDSLIKGTGILVRYFEKKPRRYQDPGLWAWLEMLITPKRNQFKNNTLSPAISFSTQYPKRYCKSSCCGPFEAEVEHP